MRHLPLGRDIAWQMWIARQLIGGASLYHDILETNPPLWFWLAVPVQRLAERFEILPQDALIGAVFGYIALAQLLFARLIADLEARRRAWLLVATAIAVIFVPIADFAQREHLVLIAAIPYCALVACRAEERVVPWWLAVAVGLLAAVTFALKHYFVAPLLLLEVWILWRLRREWNPFRPELLALVGAATLYAASLYLCSAAYLTTIVPMLKLAYSAYGRPLRVQLINPNTIFWILGALLVYGLRAIRDSLTMAYAVAVVGFVVCYFIQHKGFSYHAIPATGLLFIILGILLPMQHQARTSSVLYVGTMSILGLVLTIPLVVGLYVTLTREEPSVIKDLLRGTPRGSSVIMLTADPSRIWPMVENQGYVWPSRYFGMWMLPAFAEEIRTKGKLSLPMQELAREVRAQTLMDLKCNPPEIIIIHDLPSLRAKGIDTLGFFSQEHEFLQFFANYDSAKTGKLGGEPVTSFVRRPGWRPSTPAEGCRKIY